MHVCSMCDCHLFTQIVYKPLTFFLVVFFFSNALAKEVRTKEREKQELCGGLEDAHKKE